jgi:hypothetical protein
MYLSAGFSHTTEALRLPCGLKDSTNEKRAEADEVLGDWTTKNLKLEW